ncbi:MAG: hypothetical protein IPP72_19065 [Chitinophagaceae bacterium]|nr:hypothetical protein [Chitinophagaceae bacterium]
MEPCRQQRQQQKNNSRYAFDAEDYHRSLDETNQEEGRIATQLENAYFNNAAYITAASPMIAAAYKKNYPLKDFVVINNVFSVSQQPAFSNIVQQPLKLFWFSQTVGLKRGIQDVINAINNIRDFTIEFSVLGDASAAIKAQLQSLLLNSKHSIHFIPPCNEEELIRLAAMHHIGLALEPGFSLNNKIALSNKLFTYLLAGNAVIVSNTPAQELYYNSYPDTAWCYQIGNIKQLTAIIQQAGTDEVLLNIKRKAAWQAANTTLNWETEQQQFLKLVKAIA